MLQHVLSSLCQALPPSGRTRGHHASKKPSIRCAAPRSIQSKSNSVPAARVDGSSGSNASATFQGRSLNLKVLYHTL